MIHPWLEEQWRQLLALEDRLPHALLFAGPPGVGKRALADELAAHLLCRAPGEAGLACGMCTGCALRLSGNHPDLLVIEPAAASADAEADADSDTKAAKKSSQIVIEQIRDLQDALTVTGHQGSRRVVIVEPAQAMNMFTANALLKLLEEPPVGCILILVSSAPRRLLPTIRSRCQQWVFARPQAAQVAAWLKDRGAADAALLAISGGMPLAAERLAGQGAGEMLERFTRDIARVPDTDPLVLAGQWEAWLKSKEATAAGLDMSLLVDWMQRWVSDLSALRLGGRLRFFPSQEKVLSARAARAGIAAVVTCYNEFARIRRVAQHPLNVRLMLEDMLLRYARVVSGPRS